MTRAEQPTVVTPTSGALAADSRERAVRALLRIPPLKRLWSAQFVGGVGDSLALLVLVLLSLQAAVTNGSLGGGYRGAAFAVAAVFGARLLATLLFGAVLLGPLSALISPSGPLDRRWTMIGADGVRLALLIVAPLWADLTPDSAFAWLLVTAFLAGVAERFWTVAKDGAAPALLPSPPPEGAAVRPLPDHYDALRRLSLRTTFISLPVAGAALVVVSLIGKLIGTGVDWFDTHQAAIGSYVAAGLFAASVSILYLLHLPGAQTPRARSPLEGMRRPKTPEGPDRGRTGAIPVLVLACAAIAGAIAAAVAVAALQAIDLGGGPVAYGLLVLALSGGPVIGIRSATKVLPGFSRRRLLALAVALTGLALLVAGLVPDTTTALLLVLLAGVASGVAAATGHALLDQETEEGRRARTTEHLHAVVRLAMAISAVVAPVLAAAIGPHRLISGNFVFAHGGAAFTLMLVGALLLPVAALVLGKTDDRHGVRFRRDLLDVLRGGDPVQAPSGTGFFLAFEGGDGAGKSTQVEAVAEWIRGKGHEVVVTREPGATAMGKRLRSILLDVSSAGISDRAEALLYAADRAEHVDSLVRPALERGAVVITDRYIDSSVAYQGAGRDLSPTEIARISRWATDGLVPHLTVLLDVSPETARERFTEAPDRLESEPAEFHQRVRAGFLTLAAADPARYLVVDAGQEPESVTTVVRHRLDHLLPLSEAEIKAQEEARKAAEEEARRKAEEEAARKAEEERLERERQEQLAKLRAEEEERKRRELEEARRLEAERQAEEARKAEEEAARKAEEERKRREAEERAHAAEQERLRKQHEEEARLRAEAEARRLEKQRKAEEALLRAEQARVAAAAAAARKVPEASAGSGVSAGAGVSAGSGEPGLSKGPVVPGTDAPTVETPAVQEAPDQWGSRFGSDSGSGSGSGSDSGSGSHASGSDSEKTQTVETPRVDPRAGSSRADSRTDSRADADAEAGGGARPMDETAVLPSVRPEEGGASGTSGASDASASGVSDSEETAVLPQPPQGAMDETTVLPPVRPERSADPADRVPPWLFRPEDEGARPASPESENERTRELPQVDPDRLSQQQAQQQAERQSQQGRGRQGQGARSSQPPQSSQSSWGAQPHQAPQSSQEERGGDRKRRRPEWAEETPLDDLPTLADELLGRPDEDRRRGR
ncbi:dTMP kinase [Streptomyces sp. NPDC050610]|uniref:dTMP kinase n=1 Tax=Streptomyces sp. NPDC050610 TaxID=3157097 RepID=UPI003418C35D